MRLRHFRKRIMGSKSACVSTRSVTPISSPLQGLRAISATAVLSASNTSSDLGKIGDFLPFEEQRQQIFGVTDFKLGVFDIELGLGPGLTSGSDRLVAKAILDTVSRSPAERSQSAAAYEGSLAAGCREFSRFYRILFVAVTSGPARPAGWFHGARIPVLYGNRVLISCHSGRAPANLRGRYEQPQ